VSSSWEAIFLPPARGALEKILAEHIASRRWFRQKTRSIRGTKILSAPRLPLAFARARIVVVEVELDDGARDRYVMPLAFVYGREEKERLESAVLRLQVRSDRAPYDVRSGILVDAIACDAFLAELLATFRSGASVRDGSSELRFRSVLPLPPGDVRGRPVGREQTNTSIVYGDRFVAKVLRKLDAGESPDVEVGRFLTEAKFAHAPALHAFVDVSIGDSAPATLAVLHQLAPNQGDAWEHTLRALDTFLTAAWARDEAPPAITTARGGEALDLLQLAGGAISTGAIASVGPYAELARLLGNRIGEMHHALGSAQRAAFKPEPLDAATRLTLARSARADLDRALDLIAERDVLLDADARADAKRLFEGTTALRDRIARVIAIEDPGCMVRVHGDLHLGQVLFTGDDYALIDFEGEPARSLEARRAKRSPIVDIAGMLRSFHYAAASALRARPEKQRRRLEPWANVFRVVASAMLLRGWLAAVGDANILPHSRDALRALLDFFVLEKCIYEVRYELDNRPAWVAIPLAGLVELARPTSEKGDAR